MTFEQGETLIEAIQNHAVASEERLDYGIAVGRAANAMLLVTLGVLCIVLVIQVAKVVRR